jgi:hypothetical protein
MLLLELFDAAKQGYQDQADDKSAPKWKDMRKTKLTLRQITKLRKMLDVRNYEAHKNLEKVRKQYNAPPQEGGGL